MKNHYYILLLPLIIFSCNSDRDDRFCECMNKSTQLDKITSEVISGKRTLSSLNETEKQLKLDKDSICAPFELLGGEELIKKQNACK